MQNVIWLMVLEGETNTTMGKAQKQDQEAEMHICTMPQKLRENRKWDMAIHA